MQMSQPIGPAGYASDLNAEIRLLPRTVVASRVTGISSLAVVCLSSSTSELKWNNVMMSDSKLRNMLTYAGCGICGVAFGIACEKSRVHDPIFIRGQMDFSSYVMMKMFLGATAAGMASMAFLYWVNSSCRQRFVEARKEFAKCMHDKGVMSSILGGGLLGAGITVAGSCPGMVLVQVGSNTGNALLTYTGGLLAVTFYGLMEPIIVKWTRPSQPRPMRTLDNKYLGYLQLALVFPLLLGGVVATLEYWRPWTTEVSVYPFGHSAWTAKAWPPYISGCIVGLLQMPIILLVGDTLGTATSYCTIVSQLLVTDRLRATFRYLAKYRSGAGNYWQVCFVGGIMAGAYLSSKASGMYGSVHGVPPREAVLGGFLMLFGARLAAGCTSGHGLSGMALLVVNSFVTVAAMFSGAISMQYAMKNGVIRF